MSTDDYTPTTERVRSDYVQLNEGDHGPYPAVAAEFDRWLAQHDREVKAAALREVADVIDRERAHDDTVMRPLMERADTDVGRLVKAHGWDMSIAGKERAARIIRDRADRIEGEAS